MKHKSLQVLADIQAQLASQRETTARAEARRKASAQRLAAERDLFVRTAGRVQPLRTAQRVALVPKPPPPLAAQRQRDEQAVMAESISDSFDNTTLLEVDASLSFRRPGIGPDVTRKLRKGEWAIQGEIDLHGLRTDEAREALARFIREAASQGLRCLRVVHGKGLGSPGKSPVLKAKVHSWLIQKNQVLAFVQARADEGGAGAVVVLLKPAR